MAITIRKLQEQYGGEWGDHPDFPVEDWQQEVAADDTRKVSRHEFRRCLEPAAEVAFGYGDSAPRMLLPCDPCLSSEVPRPADSLSSNDFTKAARANVATALM